MGNRALPRPTVPVVLTSAIHRADRGRRDGGRRRCCPYTRRARSVKPAGIALYRQWWALADVAAFTDDLRRPHGDGEDAAAALTYLAGYLESATD